MFVIKGTCLYFLMTNIASHSTTTVIPADCPGGIAVSVHLFLSPAAAAGVFCRFTGLKPHKSRKSDHLQQHHRPPAAAPPDPTPPPNEDRPDKLISQGLGRRSSCAAAAAAASVRQTQWRKFVAKRKGGAIEICSKKKKWSWLERGLRVLAPAAMAAAACWGATSGVSLTTQTSAGGRPCSKVAF